MNRLLRFLTKKCKRNSLGHCDIVRDYALLDGKARMEYLNRVCDRDNFSPHMSYRSTNEKMFGNFKRPLKVFHGLDIYYRNTGLTTDRDTVSNIEVTGKQAMFTLAEAIIRNGGLRKLKYPFDEVRRITQIGESRRCLYFRVYTHCDWNGFPRGILRVSKKNRKLEIIKEYCFDEEEYFDDEE